MSATYEIGFFVDYYGGAGSHLEESERAMTTAAGAINAARCAVEESSCQLVAHDVAAVSIRFVAASALEAEAISADVQRAVGSTGSAFTLRS